MWILRAVCVGIAIVSRRRIGSVGQGASYAFAGLTIFNRHVATLQAVITTLAHAVPRMVSISFSDCASCLSLPAPGVLQRDVAKAGEIGSNAPIRHSPDIREARMILILEGEEPGFFTSCADKLLITRC